MTAARPHWQAKMATTVRAMARRLAVRPAKSTSPGLTTQSTARPERVGSASVQTTTATTRANVAASFAGCAEKSPSMRRTVDLLARASFSPALPAVAAVAFLLIIGLPPRS